MDFQEIIFCPMLSAFFMDLLKEFREFSRMNLNIFVTKFPGGKIQFCPRNFTNIAEINRKTHGICRKRIRKFKI